MMGTRVLRWRWMTVEVMCLARRRFLSKEPSNTVTGGRIERAAERSFTGGRPPHGSIHKVAIDVHRPARGPVQTKNASPIPPKATDVHPPLMNATELQHEVLGMEGGYE
ncbi:hypothetical protein CDL15_Pgr020397 [Punica granatum]|uniref:Uncharacterized protein n=1 Tax=Punica granatum TaxID=22663 RepID=A0A218VWH3_PUNGR|nr:hypothetical protein CDL15_Pgr020397 [Punica granatum]